MKIIALIPAYEPEENMLDLLENIKKDTDMDIVVVNDGSSDACKDIFSKAKEFAKVLEHEVNKGKGRALKTGLNYINDNYKGEYIVVTMDADGQHTIEDALKICDLVKKSPDILVLGKRFFGEDVPLRSRFGNAMTRLVYKIATGVKVYDTQTGLRAFSYKLVPLMLEIKGERYEYEINVLMECSKNNIEIKEIDIATIYINNNSGSHFNVFKDSYRIYKEIFKFCAASIICFLVDYALYCIGLVFTVSLGKGLSTVVSNVFARIVSSVLNFTLNKKVVFKRKGNTLKLAISYFMLALCILAGNTIVLKMFVEVFNIDTKIAKLITELIFFIISWFIQKFLIFKKKEEEAV
jgi:gtrA family protein